MIFKKTYGELVQGSLGYLTSLTQVNNTSVGGITRSLIEIINKNIADYYDILDTNMAMGFVSTAEGYYLDLIGKLFNMDRLQPMEASAIIADGAQKFYVLTGTLSDKLPSLVIPAGTTVGFRDGTATYRVVADVSFNASATEVYVAIESKDIGSKYNALTNMLTVHNLAIQGLYTTNVRPISNGADTETDANYRFRIMNATLSAEKANEVAVRLAALSVSGVANAVLRPYARGLGTFDVIVIPVSGIAGDALVASVQAAINKVTAFGNTGTAIKPTIVPVNLEVKLIFSSDATDFERSQMRALVTSEIERYVVNIPIGGTFILNELRQRIMDVNPNIVDHLINCYFFRNEPTFIGNVSIYWDELFYPDPSMSEAIRVL